MTDFSFTYWSIPYIVTGLFTVAIASLLFLKKGDDEIVGVFSLGCLLATLLAFITGAIVCTVNVDYWKMEMYVYYFTDLIGLSMVYHFSHLYRVKKKVMEDKWPMLMYVLPLLFMIFIIAQPSLLEPDIQNKLGDPTGHILPGRGEGPVGAFFQFYLMFIFAATFVNFIRMFRQKKDMALRRQGSYFVFAFFFPLIGTVLANFFKMALDIRILINTSILVLPVSMCIITYGIIRENLFNIELIIKKSILYAMVSASLAGVFFLVEKLMERMVEIEIAGQTKLSGLLSAGIVIVSSMPIKTIGKKLIDRWFPEVVDESIFTPMKKRDLDIYMEQMRIASTGKRITEKEKSMLDQLRTSMGISDKEHDWVKEKMMDDEL